MLSPEAYYVEVSAGWDEEGPRSLDRGYAPKRVGLRGRRSQTGPRMEVLHFTAPTCRAHRPNDLFAHQPDGISSERAPTTGRGSAQAGCELLREYPFHDVG